MMHEQVNINKLELERGLGLKSFKFKRLYAITLQDTIRSFPNFQFFQLKNGDVNINSDDSHVNTVITECIAKMREGVSLQLVNNAQSQKFLELLSFMVDFAKLEEQWGDYEAVFNDDDATGAVVGSLFYKDISMMRFAYTRIDAVSLENFQNKEKELISKYIPKNRLDESPELFGWLLNDPNPLPVV